MATRVITERLLVRATGGGDARGGMIEDELTRLCERRDRLVSELELVEERMRTTAQRRPGSAPVL